MKFFRKHIVLILIIFLAAMIRIWDIGNTPPSPDWDEAALGWNAYSILKTGKDEYGISFPLSLRSFDDYKPPLYMYLTVPFVWVFGLDTWIVRLPSALMGISAVLAVYFITRELSGYQKKYPYSETLPFIVSALFALSPWHIQFSRIAFEANIGLGLTLWGVTFFLWGVKRPRFYPLSAMFFALTLYAYHSQRIFTPLLVLILGITFWKYIISQKKYIIFAIVTGIVVVLPLLPVLFDKTTLTRLRGTSALADQTVLLQQSAKKLTRDAESGNKIGLLFDNRRVVFVQKLLEGYLSHYSLRWWFITGDNARHHAPGMGLAYLVELPFFLIGLYQIAKRSGKLSSIIFGWFLIAPIAASPTTELPHSIRTLVFLPTLQFFIGSGLIEVFSWLKNQKFLIYRIGVGLILVCFTLNISLYFDLYFKHTNTEYSSFWQYGYKEAVAYASAHKDQYAKIVISTKLEQPYMFFLYFLKYDPQEYLQQGGTASGGFEEVKNRFGKYEFRPIHWEKETKDGNTLYIGSPSEIPSSIHTIYYLNGQEAMRIAK